MENNELPFKAHRHAPSPLQSVVLCLFRWHLMPGCSFTRRTKQWTWLSKAKSCAQTCWSEQALRLLTRNTFSAKSFFAYVRFLGQDEKLVAKTVFQVRASNRVEYLLLSIEDGDVLSGIRFTRQA